ncbi:MAG: hypothetical protein ACHREM_20660 [Polyangiales bacterium]
MTKSHNHLALFGLCLGATLFAACTDTTAPAPTSTGATAPPIAAGAVRGDIVGTKLFTLPKTTVVGPRDAMSRAVPMGEPLTAPKETVATHSKQGILRLAPGAGLSELKIPITSASGAKVIVGSLVQGRDEKIAALHELTLASPSGLRVEPKVVTSAPSEGGKTFEMLKTPMHTGVWELDESHGRGEFSLKLSPTLQASGATVVVFEPSSTLDMSVLAVHPIVAAGDTGVVRVTLMDGATPITGATLDAHLSTPTKQDGPAVTMREIGGGVYEGTVTDALTEKDKSDAYTLNVNATGTTGSARFVRTGATAFTYVVPTGRITSIGTPRVVRDAGGKVTAFEADFSIEASSSDRFEVNAFLTTTGADGLEHPVAEAQTAENFDAGMHTLTLSFDAGYPQIAAVAGELHLRKVTLFSQGQQILLQRDEEGFKTAFPVVKLAELKPLAVIPPGLQMMIDKKTGGLRVGPPPRPVVAH